MASGAHMLWRLTSTFLLSLSFVSARNLRTGLEFETDPALLALDSMQQYMIGHGTFDREDFAKFKNCMDSVGKNTYAVHNKVWQGLIDYWEVDGTLNDRWGSYKNGYIEQNITKTSLNGMLVYEPCNSASNVAYYHTLLELCHARNREDLKCMGTFTDPVLRSIAYLMPSSYFHHASSTSLGFAIDIKIIDIISYALYQGSLSGIPYDPIIHDLSREPRRDTSIGAVAKIEKVYHDQRVTEWQSSLSALDVPSRLLTIGAFLVASIAFSLNNFLVRLIAPLLIRSYDLPSKDYDFLTEIYLPKILEAKTSIKQTNRLRFFKDSLASTLKFGYAFLWLTPTLDASRGPFGRLLNFFGSRIMKLINFKLNLLNSFDYSNSDFQHAKDVFPGEKRCNDRYPHTKWHVQSAIAMVDTIKLANSMCLITNA